MAAVAGTAPASPAVTAAVAASAGGWFRTSTGPDSVAGVAAGAAAAVVVVSLGAGATDVAAVGVAEAAAEAAVAEMMMSSRSKDRTNAPSREKYSLCATGRTAKYHTQTKQNRHSARRRVGQNKSRCVGV